MSHLLNSAFLLFFGAFQMLTPVSMLDQRLIAYIIKFLLSLRFLIVLFSQLIVSLILFKTKFN